MTAADRGDFTRLLLASRVAGGAGAGGDAPMTPELFQTVYAELRRLAASQMRKERAEHTLQPTALVHEIYLKLVDESLVAWQDRAHFMGVAARAMRQVLVDHARRRGAAKRGGAEQRVTLETSVPDSRGRAAFDLVEFEDALEKLAGVDERAARVAELRILGGLTNKETASVLAVSERTVNDDWAIARMWLGRELSR